MKLEAPKEMDFFCDFVALFSPSVNGSQLQYSLFYIRRNTNLLPTSIHLISRGPCPSTNGQRCIIVRICN